MGPMVMVHAGASRGARLRAERDDGDGHILPAVQTQVAGRLLRSAQFIAIAGANCPSRSIRNELKGSWDTLVSIGLRLALSK